MVAVLATFSEWHLILALIIIFLLFGGKKLPELARGLGEAMKEFKKAQREANNDEQQQQQRQTYAQSAPAPQIPAATPMGSEPPAAKPGDHKLN